LRRTGGEVKLCGIVERRFNETTEVSSPRGSTGWREPITRKRLLHVVFAASGAAALIYQVLWVRAFASVFGVTAEAAAAVLSAFFLGLALGSDRFGRVADATPRPLRLYAWLELGIAVAALPVPAVLLLYRTLYGGLYDALAGTPAGFTLLKMGLAGVALLPATLLMGGTLPALGRAVLGDEGALGEEGGRLYAANIAGAVAGAILATFALPLWLGVRGSYGLAVGLSLAIAAISGWLSRDEPRQNPAPAERAEGTERHAPWARRLLALAFASGFATIGLELLWTRMLALVFQNSVYSFGSVVAVFLAGLAAGAVLVARLLKRYPAWRVLRASLLATAALVALTPAALTLLTGGLEPLAGHGGWLLHSLSTVGLTAAVILLPVVAAGMTLPCVWELWRDRPGSGSRLGRPTAVNTVGGILGPLVAGFVALPALGTGGSLAAVAALYLVMGEAGVPRAERPPRGGMERFIIYPLLVGVALFASPLQLPVASTEPGERLLWSKEGPRGAVAVVDRGGDRRIKLDNHYALGGSRVAVEERRQGHLPLLLHAEPRRVAFIGMGTGITAGAALQHPAAERIVVLELVPEAVEAAGEFFEPWNGGLLADPRVTVIAEDGRNHLAGTDERFDVIVGDLFVPWRAGVGALYTQQHFESVKARLEPGGIFAQWLPLWQLSRREFDIIAATFLSVFDHVTVWRGLFNPDNTALALIAHGDGRPVDLPALAARLAALRAVDPFDDSFLSELTAFMVLYAGDLSGQAGRLAQLRLNTDQRPRIEWLAPRTLRAVQSGSAAWLNGPELADLFDAINASRALPGDRLLQGAADPFLYRSAGADFYRAEVLAAAGDIQRAGALRERAYRALAPVRR
jgi:spermidine synthase